MEALMRICVLVGWLPAPDSVSSEVTHLHTSCPRMLYLQKIVGRASDRLAAYERVSVLLREGDRWHLWSNI